MSRLVVRANQTPHVDSNGMWLILVVIFVGALGPVVAIREGRAPVIKEHPSSVVASKNDPATLNCAASEASDIAWFHDGKEVITSTEDPRSHRILLPSGSLFFLRVTSSKKDSDAGVYWCVASNKYGSTQSHNATLIVAFMAEDFQLLPESTVKVKSGNPLTLPCRPPLGAPEPSLSWSKDGMKVTNTSRITVTYVGDLIFSSTIQEDSGIYVCHASNRVGSHDSSPTSLTVMSSPWIVEWPQDVMAATGMKVDLTCRAEGRPVPTITWRRLDGKMPEGRSTIIDQRLVISSVMEVDSGVYICKAENEAGTVTATARLDIIDFPQLLLRPQSIYVMAGKPVQLACRVQGDPKPLLFWRLPNKDKAALLFPAKTSGHITISKNGQKLKIDPSSPKDSGHYICWGINSGGGASAEAEVKIVSAYPPPVIGIGPQDRTVRPGDNISFPCEAVSEASVPDVSWWHRRARHMPAQKLTKDVHSSRISLPSNGALIIRDVQFEDSGIYSCDVTAETGTVKQEAVLQVEDDTHASESQLLPAPPSKPHPIFINETAINLTWLPNSQVSGNHKLLYQVENWQDGWDEWRVASPLISQESCVISDLSSGHTYTFLVRAVTKHGKSFPSPWSDPVTTQTSLDSNVLLNETKNARRRLSRLRLTLSSVTIINPESVLITWEAPAPTDRILEGVVVYAVSETSSVTVASVLGSSKSHHMQHLEPNTQYTFFIVPFWQSIEGTPSNSYTLTMPEDVPQAAPSDIQSIFHKNGSTLITWSALPPKAARGNIHGYLVALAHNGTQVTERVSSTWMETHIISPGSLYTVQVAAVTTAGQGPFSHPVLMDTTNYSSRGVGNRDSDGSDLYNHSYPFWLVYLLVPLVILAFGAMVIYARRLHQKSISNFHQSVSLYSESSLYPDNNSANLYSDQKLWRPSDSDKDSSLSSMQLLPTSNHVNEYAEPRGQETSDTPEPYATTTLLMLPTTSSPRLNRGVGGVATRRTNSKSNVNMIWGAMVPPATPPRSSPTHGIEVSYQAKKTETNNINFVCSKNLPNKDESGQKEVKRDPSEASPSKLYNVCAKTNASKKDKFLTFTYLQAQNNPRPKTKHKSSQPKDPP